MGVIHIENVDDKVLEAIQWSADRNGRTLEDELRDMLEQVAQRGFDHAEFLAAADRIRDAAGGVAQDDSTDIIRELRDQGYSSLTENHDHAGR